MKKRHIKSIDEKYGRGDITKEHISFMKNYKDEKTLWLFNNMPYIGILYVPATFEMLRSIKGWHGFNYSNTLKKCKITSVGPYHINFIAYDYINDSLVYGEVYKDDFYMEGNVLKLNIGKSYEPKN